MSTFTLDDRKIAVQYAKALFEASVETKAADGVLKSLLSVGEVCEQSPELKEFLQTPSIPQSEKLTLVQSLFKDKVEPLVYQIITVMIENGRGTLLLPMAQEFEIRYNHYKHIAQAELITAAEIPAALGKKFQKILEERFGYKTVVIENRVDPGILGGAIIKLNDQVIDGSYIGKLESLRKEIQTV